MEAGAVGVEPDMVGKTLVGREGPVKSGSSTNLGLAPPENLGTALMQGAGFSRSTARVDIGLTIALFNFPYHACLVTKNPAHHLFLLVSRILRSD